MSREELRGAVGFIGIMLGSYLMVGLGIAVLWWIGSQIQAAILGLPW